MHGVRISYYCIDVFYTVIFLSSLKYQKDGDESANMRAQAVAAFMASVEPCCELPISCQLLSSDIKKLAHRTWSLFDSEQ